MATDIFKVNDISEGVSQPSSRVVVSPKEATEVPHVSFAQVSPQTNPVSEFTKPIMEFAVPEIVRRNKEAAKAAKETSKADVIRKFAIMMKDFRESPKAQEMNPFERQFHTEQMALDYIGKNMQYADSLTAIRELASDAKKNPGDSFIKVEKEGVYTVDVHGKPQFYGKDLGAFVQESYARSHEELPPSIRTSIAEKYKDDIAKGDYTGFEKELNNEVLRKAVFLQVSDSAKMMDDRIKLIHGDQELRFTQFQKTTVPILNHDVAEDLDKSLKVMQDNILNKNMSEDNAMGKFMDDFEHTINRPDILEMYYDMNKGAEYDQFKKRFDNYKEIARNMAKGLDKKNRLQYDETVDRAKLAIEDIKLKLGLPPEYRYGIENGQGLYNFGLTVQLLSKVDGIIPAEMSNILKTLAAGDVNKTKALGIKKAAEKGHTKSYNEQLAYVMNGMTNALGGYKNNDLPNIDVSTIYFYAESVKKNKLYQSLPQTQRVQFQTLYEQVKSRLTPSQVKKLGGQYANPNSIIPAPQAPGEE